MSLERLLREIEDARPGVGLPGIAIPSLIDALAALRGHGGRMLFGAVPHPLPEADANQVTAAARAALLEWQHQFAESDPAGMLELAKVADLVGIPELRPERLPLRCDPLGAVDGLDPAWQTRIARLVAVRDGAPVRPKLGNYLDDEEDELEIGPPELAQLYQQALRYESMVEDAFPRELAAWWTIAGWITVGDVPVLQTPDDWEWTEYQEEAALKLGLGVAWQGSLLFVLDESGVVSDSRVVSVDDDGEVLVTWPTFGAFVDALLTAC